MRAALKYDGTGDVAMAESTPPTAVRASAAPAAPARPTLILAIICVSYFIVILDNPIVFTGLPQIRSAMGFSETGLSWITNAYVLVFGGLLLLGARTGDLFGHRRVFLPETERQGGRFDVAGAFLATAGSTALVFGIVDATDIGWTAPATVVPLVAGGVMLALFVAVERRAAQPIVPLRLFASRERSGAYVTRMLYMGAMIGFFFFTAQFVQSVYHWTPPQAGLAFLPMTLVNFVFAVQVPRLLEQASRPRVLTTGLALTMVAWPGSAASTCTPPT
ncbi:hypothetical protein OG275_34580 [Streptomyces niveus]|uniref:hypothetical protein n=1 Tax=Streptomyces niveus TaxID=193462 RepID=UPI002E314336|nr:hypothetical protein [Streptomyces niveus]